MCLNPIRIKNPKFKTGTFDKMHDPLYLSVPCGKCWQCRNKRQNEWILRNYLEYKHTINNNGCVYFYTLTFDEEHLPRIFNKPCFDADIVTKFNKNMHNKLARYGCQFKYFLVSECGSKYERPHHHVLFYVSKGNYYKKVVKDGLISKVLIKYNLPDYDTFNKIVSSCWKMGAVKSGNNHGIVNSPFAIYYVCKYINKGGKEIKFVPQQISLRYPKFFTYINHRFGTFYRCSSGFGRNYICKLTESNFRDGVLTIPVDKKILKIPIPEYFLRKTVKEPFVNCNGNISYKLNFKGFNYYGIRFDNMVKCIDNRCKLLNEHFGTDFTSDFILHCQLDDTVPLSQLDKGFRELYFNRKYNNLFTNHHYIISPIDRLNRYYLTSFEVDKYRLFNKLNSLLNYQHYVQKQKSYNLNQRLLYGETKKEVEIKNYVNYVNLAPQLAVCTESNRTNSPTLAGDFRSYKYFKKYGLCRTRKRNLIHFIVVPTMRL